MAMLIPALRPARAADGPALADLVNMAGEGLPEYLWRGMAGPGEDPWEVGRRRQAQRAEGGWIHVVDEGAGAVATLTSYALAAEAAPIPDDVEPIYRPLLELENLARPSWYVNVLAAYPRRRGRGHGARLMALAEDLARAARMPAMSIIVADRNAGARRLYERLGYAEAARRPIVKRGWRSASDEWVLMTKRL